MLERELALRHGTAEVAVVHRLLAGGPVTLALEAFVTWRDAHGERRGDGPLRWSTTPAGAVVDGAFRIAGPGWRSDGAWYRGVHARRERERGLNAEEDVWLAGRFTAELDTGDVLPVSGWRGAADPRTAGRDGRRRPATGPGRCCARPASPTRSPRGWCSPPTRSSWRGRPDPTSSPATRGSAPGRGTR